MIHMHASGTQDIFQIAKSCCLKSLKLLLQSVLSPIATVYCLMPTILWTLVWSMKREIPKYQLRVHTNWDTEQYTVQL